MSHDYTDKIICPHCNEEFTANDWEHNDYDGDQYTCDDCDKDFILGVHPSVSYSTTKVSCKNGHDLDIDNTDVYILDQKQCDFRSRENFLGTNIHKPYKAVTTSCKNCDHEVREKFDLKDPCEKGTHVWGEVKGDPIASSGAYGGIRQVYCKNCDAYNFVDSDGKIRYEHLN